MVVQQYLGSVHCYAGLPVASALVVDFALIAASTLPVGTQMLPLLLQLTSPQILPMRLLLEEKTDGSRLPECMLPT